MTGRIFAVLFFMEINHLWHWPSIQMTWFRKVGWSLFTGKSKGTHSPDYYYYYYYCIILKEALDRLIGAIVMIVDKSRV